MQFSISESHEFPSTRKKNAAIRDVPVNNGFDKRGIINRIEHDRYHPHYVWPTAVSASLKIRIMPESNPSDPSHINHCLSASETN